MSCSKYDGFFSLEPDDQLLSYLKTLHYSAPESVMEDDRWYTYHYHIVHHYPDDEIVWTRQFINTIGDILTC